MSLIIMITEFLHGWIEFNTRSSQIRFTFNNFCRLKYSFQALTYCFRLILRAAIILEPLFYLFGNKIEGVGITSCKMDHPVILNCQNT